MVDLFFVLPLSAAVLFLIILLLVLLYLLLYNNNSDIIKLTGIGSISYRSSTFWRILKFKTFSNFKDKQHERKEETKNRNDKY